jgi:energy-converting hydrogenase Eha subunit B
VTRLAQCAGALIALATCSACGGSAVAPTASFNGTAFSATSNNFEYIINNYGSYADIFNYPKNDKQIGSITNVGGQGCTNALYGYGKGIFWIVAGADQITEYEVPKKPVKTLSDSVGKPSGCAMNAAGDLAVGLFNGDIVIFKGASGSGTVVSTALQGTYFLGYDKNGNLFADGVTYHEIFRLVELPRGSTKSRTITTSNVVGFPGSVQWDGKYLAVTDMYGPSIYRYTISGTKAMLKDTVSLQGASVCTQTWIVPGTVFCADAGNDDGEVFDYPAGGSVKATLRGNFDDPLGTVAVAK